MFRHRNDLPEGREAASAGRERRRVQSRNRWLGRARKAAKRLRYAAEAAAVIDGKKARLLERAAHSIQKVLGRHQDSVVAREVLRRLAAEAFPVGRKCLHLRTAARLRTKPGRPNRGRIPPRLGNISRQAP